MAGELQDSMAFTLALTVNIIDLCWDHQGPDTGNELRQKFLEEWDYGNGGLNDGELKRVSGMPEPVGETGSDITLLKRRPWCM